MTDDTRERARQVAHELLPNMYPPCTDKHHRTVDCDRITDALVAFANEADDTVKRLEVELAQAREAVETLTTPHLLELHIERGVMEGRIDGRGMAKIIAAAFWDLLTKEEADNYVEMILERGGRELIVHVQKRTGKTPAQLRADAESACDNVSHTLVSALMKLSDAYAERDNAARNERIRITKRVEALAQANSALKYPQTAATVLAALAAELRAGGGGN